MEEKGRTLFTVDVAMWVIQVYKSAASAEAQVGSVVQLGVDLDPQLKR